MVRHFIDIDDFSSQELRQLIEAAKTRKQSRLGWTKGRVDDDAPAQSCVLAMIFEKNSTRTRFSFDAAMRQLGGDTLISNASDMQLGRGEPIEDTARVLSRMVDAIMIRAKSHADVKALARASEVPVINGLTDFSHPCQILADIMTIEEHRGDVSTKTLAWISDGNNVCRSFIHAAAKLGFVLNIACPRAYWPTEEDVAYIQKTGAKVTISEDMQAMVKGADVVLCDTWVSMGDADEQARLQAFAPYQVTKDIMAMAAPNVLFLHCLPAHRGEEVVSEVIDGPQSVVFDEAENRIHAQKAVIAWALSKD